MPDQILHKRSLITGSIPTTSSLSVGEIALNVPDGKIYLRKSGSTGQSIESAITSNSTSSIGTLIMSGSLILSGSSGINSGSVFDVSADNISFDFDMLLFSGSAQITGSLVVTQGITGSLQGTSSYAVTSSYSETSKLTNNTYFAQGKLSGDQSIPSATDTTIEFIDHYDPQGWYDAGTYRFTPNITGYYTVSLGVWFENPNDNTVQLNAQMRVNGNQEMICQQPSTNISGVSLFGTKIVYLNGTTDYIDFTVYQGTLATIKIQQGNSAGSGTWFSATYMTM